VPIRTKRSQWDRQKGTLWSGSRIAELSEEEVNQLQDLTKLPGWEVFESLIADYLGQSVSQMMRVQADQHDYYKGRFDALTDVIHAPTIASGKQKPHTQETLVQYDPAARGWLPTLQRFCKHPYVLTLDGVLTCRSCGAGVDPPKEEDGKG